MAGTRKRTENRPALSLVPPPRQLTEQEQFLRFIDQQDTRTRKIAQLSVGRFCEELYAKKGRAGWGGNIRELRNMIADLEHELATVAFIDPPRGKS